MTEMFAKIQEVLKGYDMSKLTIGVLGGHSELDVCRGAKKFGFRTLAVCQKGREKTYSKFFRSRQGLFGQNIGCVDQVLEVDSFADIVKPEIQQKLRELNTIFIHNRYFWVYCDFKQIENDFFVPIFGNRDYVKLEERDQPMNQYVLLEKAGIHMPKIIRKGGDVQGRRLLEEKLDHHFVQEKGPPLIVKVNESIRSYERAFFIATNTAEYFDIGGKMIAQGMVKEEDLDRAVIEEFIIGAQVNFNFFYCPFLKQVELMGTDMRRQTSLDGFLRLNAVTQTTLMKSGYKPSMIETGHVACTIKESLIQKVCEMAEQFVITTAKELGRPITGPFALQGAVAPFKGKEDIVIFDVSMRIPGSPGTASTPYSGYLFGDSISYGERIAMALKVGQSSMENMLQLVS